MFLVLEIISLGNHFGRPRHCTSTANANSTVAAVTWTSKYRKLPVTNETVAAFTEGQHLGWCIRNRRLASFFLRCEGERLEVLGGSDRIGGNASLVGVDGGNPQISCGIVIHRSRKQYARMNSERELKTRRPAR